MLAGHPAAGDQHPMERPLDPSRLGDHLDRLYRAAWAFSGSREEAEDLVQETYARVLARPRLLRNEDDLGYLLRALRNVFLSQRRNQSRRLRPGPLPEELDLLADPHAREPQAALEAGELYAAIAALPDDFRDVLVAVDISGPLLPGGSPGAADPRGNGDEPPLPRPPAGRTAHRGAGVARGRALVAGVHRSDEHLLTRRGLIAVGLLARDGERREALGCHARPQRDVPAFVERSDRNEHARAVA